MTILSKAVAIADKVTLKLKMQAQGEQQVTLKSFVDDGGNGAPTYNPTNGKKYNAVVEKKQREVRTFGGTLSVSNATVTFLVPTIAVKDGDIIILADGTGGPVIGAGGPIDASGQLITEAYL